MRLLFSLLFVYSTLIDLDLMLQMYEEESHDLEYQPSTYFSIPKVIILLQESETNWSHIYWNLYAMNHLFLRTYAYIMELYKYIMSIYSI